MICFDQGNNRFNFRIGGICVHQGCLLVEKDSRYDFFVVPGGRCEFHESTRDSVLREIFEETGQKAEIDRLLWIVESFFSLDNKNFHEIGFYYKVTLGINNEFYHKKGFFKGPENHPHLSYLWLPLEEAKDLKVFPHFLINRLTSMPTQIEHIIIDERKK